MGAVGRIARAASRLLLPEQERERLARVSVHDAGHGFDPFGMHPEWVRLARALTQPLYRAYFRVQSHGAEHLPQDGPAILIANHAGTLPFDGAMICADVLSHTDPPRMPRPVADFFVRSLPFAGVMLSRAGVVNGARGNVRALLEAGELVLIFPEGLPAIGKPFKELYKLRELRVGHVELALESGAPVIPVAVIGSEEQWPQIARIDSIKPFGAPYLPIVATPLPLPVRYHIHYGEPIDLAGRFGRGHATRETVAEAARITSGALQELIDRGLSERKGIFFG
jgi:1-acyl-sn-glycerol-3-phosphate acyltransferase